MAKKRQGICATLFLSESHRVSSTIPLIRSATPISRQAHVQFPSNSLGGHVLAHSGCQFGRALPVSDSKQWLLMGSSRTLRILHRRAHNSAECFRQQEEDCGSLRKGFGIASFMYIRAKVAQGATLAPLYYFLLPWHRHGSFRDCGARKPQLLFHPLL